MYHLDLLYWKFEIYTQQPKRTTAFSCVFPLVSNYQKVYTSAKLSCKRRHTMSYWTTVINWVCDAYSAAADNSYKPDIL